MIAIPKPSYLNFFLRKGYILKYSGIFTKCESKKSFSVMTNLKSDLRIELLTKSSIVKSHIRFCTTLVSKTNKNEKKIDFKTAVMLSKFNKLKLELLLDNSAYFDEESLLILFKKMCVVYHNNKLNSKFVLNIPLFVKSEEFQIFCTLLEKHLPKIMPDDLGTFLNFELFKIPVESTLMRKIFTLILDNFNNISYLNILEIYIQLNSPYFENSIECEKIRKACEAYFAYTLENEISHSRHFEEIIYFLGEKNLPINVKKLMVERIFEVLEYESFTVHVLQKFFHYVFEPPLFEIFKDRILKVFKNNIIINITTSAQKTLIYEYEVLVSRNDTAYDEEICEIIADKSMNIRHHFSHCVLVMEKLCLMGYFNEKLLHYVIDSIFGATFSALLPYTVLQTASVLARTCYHEMNTPMWEKVKKELQLYKPDETEFFSDLNILIQWTEYLTFLGCDTRELLNTIFVFANEEENLRIKSVNCQNILRLHHMAEEYFSSGYTKLSKKNLELYLQNAIFPEKFYSLSHVYEFFGGENYIIRDCTNSHKHYIPLAIVLGPDNKPLNLSSSKPILIQDTTNRISKEMFKVFFNIENVSKPPGSKVIAFMLYNDNQPFKYRNAPITSGMSRIFQKSVRNLGCDLILLPQKYLYFEKEKKEKYLQSQIDEIIKKTESEKFSNIGESINKHN